MTYALICALCLMLAGCGSFFIGLGIMMECGPMPMGPSDCYQKPRATPRSGSVTRPMELP